ncbi:MAG: catalase HPII, partial [Rhodanobacteraceae bacterium]
VAPRLGVELGGGKRLDADGQLAGTPSVVFDAVALVLSESAGKRLAKDSAAEDFVRDAFGHLKAIAADDGAQAVLKAAAVEKDDGIVAATDPKGFIRAAKTRQWDREAKVRLLA